MQTLTRMDKVIIETITTYNNMGWRCEMDETNTSNVNFSFEPHGLLQCIYLYFKIMESLLSCTHKRKIIPLPYVYNIR